MFLCDCQHFYALFANSFEGAAEEALCTNSWEAAAEQQAELCQEQEGEEEEETVVPLEANIDLTINEEAVVAACRGGGKSVEGGRAWQWHSQHGIVEETEVEKDKHHR